MNKLASIIIPTLLSFGFLPGNASAMDINDYIKIEMAKIDFEFNCTVNGNESVYKARNQEAARTLAIAQAMASGNEAYETIAKTAACVQPKYKYDCQLPQNKNVPLSGSLFYSYWSNESTLDKFRNSESGKKLQGCRAPWW